jgi:hypothetical protein
LVLPEEVYSVIGLGTSGGDMNKLEDWQPIFRFLKQFHESDFVGLVFSIIYLIGVIATWYWVCFKNGAKVWTNGVVAWHKRFGMNVRWLTPFIVKWG